MCTKLKVWKPGQIVTIDHKKYRVVERSLLRCGGCENRYTDPSDTPCAVCIPHRFHNFCLGIQDGITLRELKPKQNK